MKKSSKTISRRTYFLEFLTLGVLIFTFALIALHVIKSNAYNTSTIAVNKAIYLTTMLFALILFSGCILVRETEPAMKIRFEGLIICSYFSTLISFCAYLMNGTASITATIAMQILANSLLAVYWIVFWRYQNKSIPETIYSSFISAIVIGYMSLYIVFSLCNFFVPIFFTTINNVSLIFRADYFSLIYMMAWYGFYLIYISTRSCDIRTKVSLASYVLFPIGLNLLSLIIGKNQFFNDIYYALNSLVFLLPLYLIYFNLHLERSRELYEQREELTAARINVMMSQIQPHFIYNSLTAILGLVDINPELAKESIVSFSDYLRVNLNALKQVTLIPFTEELEHSKVYLSFELLRFKNINVEYDIDTMDFKIPALSVQPLLENAIKHGVSQTGHGGNVTLSVKEDVDNIFITVFDDGVGFDEYENKDGVHVGLENVKKRLEDMCNASLEITSKKDAGTKATICLPKQGEKR